MFLPTNLALFIKWEMEDRARRTQVVGPPDRTVSDIAKYRDHIASQGLVSDDAVGGLYQGFFFLKDFLLPTSSSNTFEVLATPKVWHGYPMAAI